VEVPTACGRGPVGPGPFDDAHAHGRSWSCCLAAAVPHWHIPRG
jgi:hypothetical protein